MRILIIGGTGFMGPYVARGLHEVGHEVRLLHRGFTFDERVPEAVEHILHADTNALRLHREIIRAFRPDVALHMMATEAAHITGLQAVLEGLPTRIVMISSADVYRVYDQLHGRSDAPPPEDPLTEDAPLRQTRYPYRHMAPHEEHLLYTYDKIPAEEATMSHDTLPGTVLRLPMVYGPHDPQHRLHSFVKRMDDDRPAIILQADVAAWRACRGYAENMAHAIRLVTTQPAAAGRVYHAAMAETPTVAEWVRWIGREAGWAGEVVTVPRDELPEPLREDYHPAHHWLLDTSRIREELGYREVVPTPETLRRTIAYTRTHPPEEHADPFDYALEDAVLA